MKYQMLYGTGKNIHVYFYFLYIVSVLIKVAGEEKVQT